MPIHDWTRVNAGLFHHFHLNWIASLTDELNAGGLPDRYYALAEQMTSRPVPDVVAPELAPRDGRNSPPGGLALAEAPPRASLVLEVEEEIYARKANRVSVFNPLGEVVAIIEIVSPGNKDRRSSVRSFVDKTIEFIEAGVHVLVIDLFPPGPSDPGGMHKAIWDEVQERPYSPPPGKPLVVAAYKAAPIKTAYVEPVGVGDPLPSLPIFLSDATYVPAPLESTYLTTWKVLPAPLRRMVDENATV